MQLRTTFDKVRPWFLALVSALLAIAPGLAQPAATVVVSGEGVAVSTEDILADAVRLPSELRTVILGDPGKTQQLATNLYVRRVLAKRARDAGLHNEPEIAAFLAKRAQAAGDQAAPLSAAEQLVVDKVLADAFLAKSLADLPPPADDVLERLARGIYDAGDGQFVLGEQRRIRHILIDKKKDDAQARASELIEKLRQGGEFGLLAKEFSDDPGSRAQGGDLGLLTRGRTVKPFENAAFSLAKVGDIAGPVETQFGFHVLQLDEIRPAGKLPYEEVQAQIKQGLKNKLAADHRVEIVTPIRAGAKVDSSAIESFTQQKH